MYVEINVEACVSLLYAVVRLNVRKYDLPSSQAIWYLKCRALTLEQYLDDTEMEEQVQLLLKYGLLFSQASTKQHKAAPTKVVATTAYAV